MYVNTIDPLAFGPIEVVPAGIPHSVCSGAQSIARRPARVGKGSPHLRADADTPLVYASQVAYPLQQFGRLGRRNLVALYLDDVIRHATPLPVTGTG
jgi:hypothetical protein